MILAMCVGLGMMGAPPPSAIAGARLARLSAARGAFERDYRPAKDARLRVMENLGPDDPGSGNAKGPYYWPAGSADYRIAIVKADGSQGEDEHGKWQVSPAWGKLVFQSRNGRSVTTRWVLNLVEARTPYKTTGTLSAMVASYGLRIASKATAFQRKILAEKHPFIEVGGWFESDAIIYIFVKPDGSEAPGYYFCYGGASVLHAPPVIPGEALAMGIHLRQAWHGPGKYKIVFKKSLEQF